MVCALVLRREQNRQVAGPLPDPRGATHRARAEALDRRTLVGVRRLDDEVLADELMVVLGVGDRRLEQLAPVTGDRPRRDSEDSSRLLHRLAADVVAHEPRLTRARAHVLRLRAHDRRRLPGLPPPASAPAPRRRSRPSGLLGNRGLLNALGALSGRGLLSVLGALSGRRLLGVLARALLISFGDGAGQLIPMRRSGAGVLGRRGGGVVRRR